MQYAFSLDPFEILGISENASLQELRDAYRGKAKLYHPDRGGDAWAFRLVCRAYEILGTARVAGHAASENLRPTPVAPVRPPTTHSANVQSEKTRTGIRDIVDHPSKLVDVEMLILRYAITDPMQLLMGSSEDRTLSCNLNVSWPGKTHALSSLADNEEFILALVVKAFTPLAKKTRAIGSKFQSANGRFSGWLSYPNEAKIKEALIDLHKSFLAYGLGINQSTREMLLPREDS